MVLKIVPRSVVRMIRKRMNRDFVFFGHSEKNIGEYIINESGVDKYYTEPALGNQVVTGFEACFKEYLQQPLFLRQYLLNVRDCIIEPEYGWAITQPDDKLVFDSISNNGWIESYHPSYKLYKSNRREATKLEEVVSINLLKGGDANYWHFIHDLLGQVTIALEHTKPGIPFLISKELSQQKYFREAMTLSPVLSEINWIIRDKYFAIKKAWFVQAMPNRIHQFLMVRQLLQVKDSNREINRRIFLIRSEKRIRYISNKDQIENIAKKHGFEIIDADNYSFTEQIKLFSETRWLIGIHGAGLTNVIFRQNAPMSVLELFPADYLQPHYFLLSKGVGHTYNCMVGTKSYIDTSFSLDEVLFEKKIKELLY